MAEKQEVTTQVTPERTRAKRKPFGVKQSKFYVPNPQDGFHYRVINDEPGRLHQAQEGGYAYVNPKDVGLTEIKENKVRYIVGRQENGDVLYGYLMQIPREWYEEDQREKSKHLDQIDAAIRGGQIERQAGDGRYVPEGGISYKIK